MCVGVCVYGCGCDCVYSTCKHHQLLINVFLVVVIALHAMCIIYILLELSFIYRAKLSKATNFCVVIVVVVFSLGISFTLTSILYLTPPSPHTLSPPLTLSPLQLFDVVVRYDTLRNVINSVTRNLKSILLTAILALILIFLYSIFGYIFFPNDFLMPTNPQDAIQSCSNGLFVQCKYCV